MKFGIRNPRIVNDLCENILLVQRLYCCQHNHQMLSASFQIMNVLSNSIQNRFNIRIFHRTAVTYDLIKMVNEWVLHGINFFQMSECIASLNYRQYLKRLTLSTETTDKSDNFTERVMFSSPSSDKLMQIFLDDFNRRAAL